MLARSGLLALLAYAPLSTPSARAQDDACTPGPRTEIISREDVSRHALSRLTDAFAFSSRWHAASVDGYHWQAVAGGLAPGLVRWSVYVDDVPVASHLLGRSHLNALPIPIFDVECIALVEGPDLRRTGFAPSGSIRIYTKPPDVGLSLHGGAAAGNEINDPGPFRYIGSGGENVDRIGPIASAGVSVKARTWHVRADGRLDEFHVTDAALLERARTIHVESKPHIRTASAGITAAAGARHRFIAGSTRTRDLAFFEPVGLEIPAEHRIQVAGGSGRLPVTDGFIRYAASFTRSSLTGRTDDIRPDWAQDHVAADADVTLPGIRLGGGLRAADVQTSQRLSSARSLTGRFFAGIDRTMTSTWRQTLLFEWNLWNDRHAAAGYALSDVHLDANQTISLLATYGQLLPDEQDPWMWIGRGYILPAAGSIHIRPLDRRPLPRLLTLEGAWRGAITDGLQGIVRIFYRRMVDEYLPVFVRSYDPETSGYDVTTTLRGSVEGSTAGTEVTLRHRVASAFQHRLSYVLESAEDGDAAFREAYARIPTVRITYTAAFTPVDRFSLSSLVRYTSATRWPSYDTTVPDSDAPYSWELPEFIRVDVAASKRMWRNHLRVSLALRNVLNEPLRLHPAGAVFHMAVHFSVQLNVGSRAGL